MFVPQRTLTNHDLASRHPAKGDKLVGQRCLDGHGPAPGLRPDRALTVHPTAGGTAQDSRISHEAPRLVMTDRAGRWATEQAGAGVTR